MSVITGDSDTALVLWGMANTGPDSSNSLVDTFIRVMSMKVLSPTLNDS